ncbi:MAG: zinc-dependent metalloprotease [Bacteroidota bacterium]|nr:zinc-dependent metalloprotease [Bacteroidota bacterium]
MINQLFKIKPALIASILLVGTLGACSTHRHISVAVATASGGDKMSAIQNTRLLPSFEQVLPKGTKVAWGLFSCYKVDDKYYFEIPDSLLDREMLVVTRMVKAPPGLTQLTHQYGGEQLNQQVWKWSRHGDQIFIKVPGYSIRGGDNGQMKEAVANSNLETILAAFTIKARSENGKGVLIEAGNFFNSDAPAIGISASMKRTYKVFDLDNTRSYIDTIKTFPINIETTVVKTYRSAESPSDNSNGAITFELNTSIILLSKIPAKPRLYDNRVSYISQHQTDFGTDAQKSVVTSYIHRWKLEPKDEAAYERGELVEPKKPIIFYIDPATPAKWVPYLIKGVNDWQKAFEAAGFKNAIIGRRAPTTDEDPGFSTEDVRYSVIRYYASDQENAYGPHVADPRSGEIIESHIGWFYNQMKELHDWYFIQTSAANPAARSAKYSDEVMGELIRYTCSHEVGHTLGLPHNWGSSSAYPVDSLRSRSFTSSHGTAPSIMDYSRFNYIAQPGDGVTQFSPKIGEYDLWAIKWGYSWFPGNQSPEQEKQLLDVWTNERAGNPLYFFGQEFTDYDPRIQNEDIGDNAIKAGLYGIANLKRELPNLQAWSFEKGKDYGNLKDLYNQVLAQYERYLDHVVPYIGGMYVTNKTQEQKEKSFDFVNQHDQQKAIEFLSREAFETPQWLIDKAELAQFDNGLITEKIKAVQTGILESLLAPARLARLYNAEVLDKDHAYFVTKLLHQLQQSIFKAAPDPFQRNLQRSYVKLLSDLLKSNYKFNLDHDSPDHGNTPIDVSLSDIKPMVRAELENLKTNMPSSNDKFLQAHYKDLKYRINEALNLKSFYMSVLKEN